MSRLKKYSLLLVCVLWVASAQAQYYSWGPSPASVKWRRIETPAVKLIYPADFEENARRMLWYLDTVRTHIDFGYRHGAMRSPVVVHNRNMIGNGMVMWAPKRIELLASPSATYSEPWLKQLAIHEYRHNVQYNNLRRSTDRLLTRIFGEQMAFLGVGQFSMAILEGDAVMAETEMSAFGRGLQPSWTMHYRAVGRGSDDMPPMHGKDRQRNIVGSDAYASDYWFSGSYRDHVPDHYRLGYQLVRWSYDRFDKFIWDDVAHYVARNPQWVLPMIFGMEKLYHTGTTGLLKNAFADLNAYWDSLPQVEDSSSRIATPETSYTTYSYPLWLDDGTLVAFKSDLDRTSRIVRVDVAAGGKLGGKPGGGTDGKPDGDKAFRDGDHPSAKDLRWVEQVVAGTGIVSSRPVLSGGVLWWTEFRQSTLWDQKVSSRLCSYDFASGCKRVYNSNEQVFYPTPVSVGEGDLVGEGSIPRGLAYVSYDYSGRFSIVHGGVGRIDFPLDVEITGLAWDDSTGSLYFIGLDDGGMFLGAVQGGATESASTSGIPSTNTSHPVAYTWRRLTPSRHITISDLRAFGGKLWFGSIVSGKDEAHCYDLATGTEYRISESAFGSFQPSPSADGGRVAMTTYDRGGYHLAVQSTAGAAVQQQRELPVNLVNPNWKRWDLPVMDSIVYSDVEEGNSLALLTPRKYRKGLNIFRPHSWLPLDFYPPRAIEEADLTMNLGATVMSQSLLSDAVSWLSYGWTRRGGSMLRGGLSYSGLGAVLDVDFTWGGGTQILYTSIPQELDLDLKNYFSATTRLSLPMVLGSGHWYSVLTPSVEYYYTNGLIFERLADRPEGTLTRGVERLSFGAAYSGQTRMAQKEFLPHWGVVARAGYVTNPTNRDFRSLAHASLRGYLPGVVRPHSTTLQLAWQQTLGDVDAPFMFRMKEVFPRGAGYDFSASRWVSGSIDYQFPVWYPERGIPRLLYLKRVRLNLFTDHARWQGFATGGPGEWNSLWSCGGDIILDVSPLRMPATNNMSIRFTIAKPSDRKGVFFNFGMDVPL